MKGGGLFPVNSALWIKIFLMNYRQTRPPVDGEYITVMESTDGSVTEMSTTEVMETSTEPGEGTSEGTTEETTWESTTEDAGTDDSQDGGSVSDITSFNNFVRKALQVENVLRERDPAVSTNMDYSGENLPSEMTNPSEQYFFRKNNNFNGQNLEAEDYYGRNPDEQNSRGRYFEEQNLEEQNYPRQNPENEENTFGLYPYNVGHDNQD